jgi:hypothetical protein
MRIRLLLRLCAAIVGALGVALILNSGLAVQELFGAGLPGDNAMARGTGIVFLVLCIRCWPNGHDVDRRPLLGLLTYAFLTTLLLSYLKLEAGFVSTPLSSVLVLHVVIALLLASLAYQKGLATNTSRINQH